MTFIWFAAKFNSPKQTPALLQTALAHTLIGTLIGTLCGWAILQLPSAAIAADAPTPQNLTPFEESVSGILCIAACNEFFEAGQASFESEIQRLQNRSTHLEDSTPILEIEPSLIKTPEVKTLEEQRKAESLQTI